MCRVGCGCTTGVLGKVGNTIDDALEHLLGGEGGDMSVRDKVTDALTAPLHAAGDLLSGAVGAAMSIVAGIVGAIGSVVSGIGNAVGSLDSSFADAVHSMAKTIASTCAAVLFSPSLAAPASSAQPPLTSVLRVKDNYTAYLCIRRYQRRIFAGRPA